VREPFEKASGSAENAVRISIVTEQDLGFFCAQLAGGSSGGKQEKPYR